MPSICRQHYEEVTTMATADTGGMNATPTATRLPSGWQCPEAAVAGVEVGDG